MKIPKLAIMAAANIWPRCAVITSIIPKSAAKNISRDPNIGAIYAKTGDKKIKQSIEKTPPKKESKKIPKSFGMDPLDYGVGAQILREINIRNVILLTNHPMKRVGIEGYGLHIVKNITLQPDHN